LYDSIVITSGEGVIWSPDLLIKKTKQCH